MQSIIVEVVRERPDPDGFRRGEKSCSNNASYYRSRV